MTAVCASPHAVEGAGKVGILDKTKPNYSCSEGFFWARILDDAGLCWQCASFVLQAGREADKCECSAG